MLGPIRSRMAKRIWLVACLLMMFIVSPLTFADDLPVTFQILDKKLAQPGVHVEALVSYSLGHLKLKIVQRELGMTSDQLQTLAQIAGAYETARSNASDRNGTLDQLRQKDLEFAQAEVRTDAAIEKILSANQKTRLNQIFFQEWYPDALLSENRLPTVATLKLSEKQQKSIDDLVNNSNRSLSDLVERIHLNRPAPSEKHKARLLQYEAAKTKAQKELIDQIAAVFTPKQRQQVAALKGKPVDVAKLDAERMAPFNEIDEKNEKAVNMFVPHTHAPQVPQLGGRTTQPSSVKDGKPSMLLVTGPSQLLWLLKTELVQQELAFTTEQKAVLRRMTQECEANRKLIVGEPNSENYDRFFAARDKFWNKKAAEIDQLLAPAQKTRLDELTWQAFLPYAFVAGSKLEMPEYLEISNEQARQIVVLCSGYLSGPSSMWGSRRPIDLKDDEKEWKEARAVELEATDDILKVLSARQRDRIKSLQGKQISLVKLQDELWKVCLAEIQSTGKSVQDLRPSGYLSEAPTDVAGGSE